MVTGLQDDQSSLSATYTTRRSSSIRRDEHPARMGRHGSGLPMAAVGSWRASSTKRLIRICVARSLACQPTYSCPLARGEDEAHVASIETVLFPCPCAGLRQAVQ